MKRIYAWLLIGMLNVPWAGPAVAQSPDPAFTAPEAPLAWNALPADQRELLQRHARDWDSLPPARQQALARGAQRWLQMDPAARAEARDRFRTWRNLPEERRELIRRHWQRFQQLDPRQQALLRENFRAFSRLPPRKRQFLRQRWLDATPTERARMLERLRERRERPHRLQR